MILMYRDFYITELNASTYHRVFRVLHLIWLVDGSYTVYVYVAPTYSCFGEKCEKSQLKEKQSHRHPVLLPQNDEVSKRIISMIDVIIVFIRL